LLAVVVAVINKLKEVIVQKLIDTGDWNKIAHVGYGVTAKTHHHNGNP